MLSFICVAFFFIYLFIYFLYLIFFFFFIVATGVIKISSLLCPQLCLGPFLDSLAACPGRIRSKAAVLVYKVLHSAAPSYLGQFLSAHSL